MSSSDAADDARAVLRTMAAHLELGDWRAVLRPPGARAGSGLGAVVGLAVVLDLVALSMQRQAQGRPHDAWDQLSGAAAVLPAQLSRSDGSTGTARAVLPAEPSVDGDAELTWRVGRLVWREQVELADLRHRLGAGRVRPRDELVEACIEHLCWVELDPFAFYRAVHPLWDDGTTMDRLRSVLCLRGTRLRQFADPTAGRLSQAVWQDIGGYRGLCAVAFDRLADRPTPAPWCGVAGTSGLPVRRGRLWAWQHARARRDDQNRLASRLGSPAASR